MFTLKTRLNRAELDDLGEYLSDRLLVPGDPDAILCDNTLRHTRVWLAEHGKDVDACAEWLEGEGGECDCEVCMNVVYTAAPAADD